MQLTHLIIMCVASFVGSFLATVVLSMRQYRIDKAYRRVMRQGLRRK